MAVSYRCPTVGVMVSLGWLSAATPAIAAGAVKLLSSIVVGNAQHRLERQIASHGEIIKNLPEGPARDGLLEVLATEVKVLAQRVEERLYRRLDRNNLAAIIAVLVVSTIVAVVVWRWHPAAHWLDVASGIFAVLVGALGFLLATVGVLANPWETTRPPDTPPEPPSESG